MRKLNIGKIKSISFLLLLLLSGMTMTVKGEDNEEIKRKIMEVKLNDDLVFGEGMSDDKDIAYGLAMDDLLIFVNEIKERNSQEKLSVGDLVTNVETLIGRNGSRFEVIVYIPLDLVTETGHKKVSTNGGITLTRPGLLLTDESEEPIAEEPIAEEPKPVETVAEEPIAEEPIVEEPKPVEPVAEEPIAEESKPVESVTEEQVAEESIVEEPVVEEPKPAVESIAVENIIPAEKGNEVEDFLLTQDNFTEIKKFMSEMKQKGQIKETGVVSSFDTTPKDASLILMDQYGGILAILSPLGTNGRINYKTHKTDTENNYNSKFILWYKK